MRAQVIVNDDYLKREHNIYMYSIVDITKVHARKKDGAVFYYKATYKGGVELTYRPHEVKVLC